MSRSNDFFIVSVVQCIHHSWNMAILHTGYLVCQGSNNIFASFFLDPWLGSESRLFDYFQNSLQSNLQPCHSCMVDFNSLSFGKLKSWINDKIKTVSMFYLCDLTSFLELTLEVNKSFKKSTHHHK